MNTSILHRFYWSLLFLAASHMFAPITIAQEMSREEAINEAGRLGTEAERIRGEAHKQVQAGADRKLLLEAERAAAERFRKALELWRAAGDYDRLAAGTEELSRIYSVLNDYDNAVSCLNHESEFWREHGNVARQVHMIWLLGIRQMQMRRNDAAIKTLEQVVEMSQAANLMSVEANALNDIAMLLERVGRGGEAEPLRAKARELQDQIYSDIPTREENKREPVNVPAQWLDLPLAPLVAEYRDVEGVRQAVLVNRSTKGIEMVQFGCVKEQNGKVRVVGELAGVGLNHGGVGPGYYYEPFALLNGPLNGWTENKMGCEGKARMAVIKAIYADRTEWEAEGTDWKSH